MPPKFLKVSHLAVSNTPHRCQVRASPSSNGSPDVCLFLCACVCSYFCKHVPLFCERVCIGRQDEHPFCYRCCPFISRSGSSAWISFPWLIISAVQWTRIPPECRVKPNHYSSMGVSADIGTLLFSIIFTFPSEISRRDAERTPRPAWFGEVGWSSSARPEIDEHRQSVWCQYRMLIGLFSCFSWQGPVCTEQNSDTCRTTLQCWKEKASLWGNSWFYTCTY